MKKNNKKTKENKTKNIKVSFTGTMLTNYSGLLPIIEFSEKLNLHKTLEDTISITDYHNVKYNTSEILSTIIFGTLAGQNRISKIESFSRDPLIKTKMNIAEKIDEDTISSRLKRFNMHHNSEFLDAINILSNKIHQRLSTTEDIIDIDSSVDTVYGNQEGTSVGFNPHKKGAKSYHPLLGFLNSTKECCSVWLRPGNTYTSNGISEFIKELVARLSRDIKKLTIRADSGFFNGDFFDTMDKIDRDIEYLVKVKMKNLKSFLSAKNWVISRDKPGWEEAEFYYKCNDWSKERKFVAVRRMVYSQNKENMLFDIPDYDYFCYVTSLDMEAFEIHDFYGDRGESENWIEALKNQLYAGWLLTDNFWANEALWLCSVLAYNLSLWMRILTDRKSFREEPATFRSWFIGVAGKVVSSGRQLFLKIYNSYHYYKRWMMIYHSVLKLDFD